MKMTRVFIPVVAPLALAISGVASAGPSGYAPPPPPPPSKSFMVRVGGSYMIPTTDRVTFANDVPFLFEDFDPVDAFRARLDPDEEWGWFINGEWKPTDHFGFELSYTDISSLSGGDLNDWFDTLDNRRDFAEFDAEVSTASMKYYPLDPSCMFQPYVGVGINYVDYSGANFRGFVRQDLEDFNLRATVDMGNSWGYTWQIGGDFNFGHDSAWLVNVAAIYIQSDTDTRFSIYERGDTQADDILLESYSGDYQLNPWLFNLGVGYKFSF